MDPGFALPEPPKGKKWLAYLLGFSFLFAAIGAVLLTAPPLNANQLTYAGCLSAVKVWMGCVSGLYPWLPFALLFGGVAGAVAAIWRWRR